MTEDQELLALSYMVEAAYAPAVQCSPEATYPSLATLRRAPHLYAAYTGDEAVALAVVSERGQIGWLNGMPEHFADAGVALIRAVYLDFGASWGTMHNPNLRAALVAASGGRLHEDGSRLSWAE